MTINSNSNNNKYINKYINSYKTPSFEQKIGSAIEINTILKEQEQLNRNQNQSKTLKIGFTNGVFDILHRGHVTYLAQAKQQCDILIVALNSDASVKRLGKGGNDVARPINSLENRMAVMASLGFVDYVTWFEEDTPFNTIELLQPNVLIKGGDWAVEKIVGYKETIARNGIVLSIPFLYETSTTALIQKIMLESNN